MSGCLYAYVSKPRAASDNQNGRCCTLTYQITKYVLDDLKSTPLRYYIDWITCSSFFHHYKQVYMNRDQEKRQSAARRGQCCATSQYHENPDRK